MSGTVDAAFRRLVLEASGHPWARRVVTGTRLGQVVAGRFVAGETLDQAMVVAHELDRQRITAMLDHLGENVETVAQAEAARDDYLAALGALKEAPMVDGAISVKLTQLGLDRSLETCVENLSSILDAAAEQRTLVMIDMESHPYVDATLEVLHRVVGGDAKVGVAIQSYLRRSQRDVFDLPAGCRVRLVKGAYLEPPEIVYVDKDDVDASFARLFVTLVARGHPVDVATHDPHLIDGVRTRVDAIPGGWSRVEYQMLYGIRRDLQVSLAGRGYPVRVYIPYGTEWYPYLTRRMAERPANVWFFLSNLARMR